MDPSEAKQLAPALEGAIRQAQYRMLSTYMPHMYVANIITGLLLGALFSNIAPAEIVFAPLTLLLAVAIYRLSYWLNPRLPQTESFAVIDSTVRKAPAYGFFYFAAMSYWVTTLGGYGNETVQLLAAFYLAIGTFCSISFNAHLPRCVYAIVLGGSVPLVIRLISIGDVASLSFAAIYGVNTIIQVIAVRRQHYDFVTAVRVRLEAEASRRDAEFARSAITRVANTDALTGLPNRRSLLTTLASNIGEPGSQKAFAFGLVDLDGFKPVNDLYGHSAGDEVIFAVARRLKAAIGPDGTVARLGGDEFGFILYDALSDEQLRRRAEQIIAVVDKPIALDEAVITISACCGLARYPGDATVSEELLQRADEALYAAKHKGRGIVEAYNKDLQTQQTRRLLVESRLRVAIADRAFDLAYQPIRDLKSDRIHSYEALARWTDPVLGTVSPAEFIPVAEQSGLISPLSEILFGRALAEAVTWPDEISLSFNLSPVQIHDARFAPSTLAALAEHQFAPRRLLLEMTETALLTDFDRAAAVIQQLRSAGISIALDDFGVGYAGFSYLEKLTFDKLKIDRSFVSGMKEDKRKRQIVKAIVEMCHNLDIKCIAEGIEHTTEVDLLRSMGCDSGQGYFLGRPGPVLSIPTVPHKTRVAS